MITVSPSRQAALADAYNALPEWDDNALPSFRAMAVETLQQLDALQAAGFTVEVSETDPYASAADMFADVRENRRIKVLGTRITGSHPFFSDDVNNAFRAVHDVYGHYQARRGFDRHGEEAAYRQHARMFSSLARRALTTETRGQNSAMIVAGGAFAPQKVALLPDHWSARDALQPLDTERFGALGHALTCHQAAGLPFPA